MVIVLDRQFLPRLASFLSPLISSPVIEIKQGNLGVKSLNKANFNLICGNRGYLTVYFDFCTRFMRRIAIFQQTWHKTSKRARQIS